VIGVLVLVTGQLLLAMRMSVIFAMDMRMAMRLCV
jgi:hypothetical protein